MKMFKSIKWRLQLWYGLILVAVLMGFGFMAYQMERNRQFRRIDDELRRRFSIVANAVHPHPPQERRPPFDGSPLDKPPDVLPPREVFFEGGFNLPPRNAGLFDPGNPNSFYFIVFRDGKEIARSTNAPAVSKSEIHQVDLSFVPRPRIDTDQIQISSKNFRVIARPLPSGEIVWIGCSIAPELSELKMTVLKLTGVGAVILVFGLAGGGWLVNRALRPVSEISATAAKISAGDLSQRINTAEAESELGQLASVLNSTFARLEAAFAQQKQFASDAAHELRTPVSVILAQTQTALNRERAAADYKQTVEACQRAAQRMRKLIESLLELTRFDAGQEVLNRMPFDLAQTVGESLDLVHPLAEEFGVKMVPEISPAKIVGDAGRLGQVVTNLLSNAIQYNQPGGEVRVRLTRQNGLAVLTVTDTGQGIAPEDLPHVFERFYRADSSRTGAGNAGLGLSICKAIVEAHGGTLGAASEIGKGSAFTVRLPM